MDIPLDNNLMKYFTNFQEEGYAVCKLCNICIKNGRSYDLKLHFNRVHRNRIEIEKYFKIRCRAATCRLCDLHMRNRFHDLKMHMKSIHQTEIKLHECSTEKEKYLMQTTDRETIVRSVIGLVVEDGISPHLLKSENFNAILQTICKSISKGHLAEFYMNENYIEGVINSVANQIRQDFTDDITGRLLTLKIDNDLGGLSTVIYVTAMFISNGEIQERQLGLTDAVNLKKRLNDDMKVELNQIVAAFWDNTKFRYAKQVPNFAYVQEIDDFINYPQIYLGDIKIEPYLGSFAQICLLNILKKSNILHSFLECRNLVKFLNSEAIGFVELFIANKIVLPLLDSPWNVGSTCGMMRDLLKARRILQKVEFEQPLAAEDQFNCNDNLWLFIEAFFHSTKYLQRTIVKFYSEQLHIGDFYKEWLKCKHLTQRLSAAKTGYNEFYSAILSDILESIEAVTNQLLAEERVAACLYLDPRFHNMLNATQRGIAVEYLRKLYCHSKNITDEMAVKNGVFDVDTLAVLNKILFDELHDIDITSAAIFRKIEALRLPSQTLDTNVLSFWEELSTSHPEEYALSKVCFAIPATQVYTKIHYSNVQHHQEIAESDLSEVTKENLTFVRLNAHLLDDSLLQLGLISDEQTKFNFNSSDLNSNATSMSAVSGQVNSPVPS